VGAEGVVVMIGGVEREVEREAEREAERDLYITPCFSRDDRMRSTKGGT
jgi:hypothetical protein